MRHRVKKIKIKYGKDSNKMILIKLVKNFIKNGHLVTTAKRAKLLKSCLERLLSKAIKNKNRSKDYLYKKIGDKKIVNMIINQLVPIIEKKNGGYLRFSLLKKREGDGAVLTRVEWSLPVVLKEKKSIKEKKEKENKKTINKNK